MERLIRLLLAVPLVFLPGAAVAQEAAFLRSLQGEWSGTGSVRPRISAPAINVRCSFALQAEASTLSMNGACRGLLVVRRTIGADLQASGGRYRGTYVGPGGVPSALSGSRQGNAINLSIRWGREVNDDRRANMTIRKVGDAGLTLTTTDRDPATGRQVVTSEINLRRT